MPAELPTPLSHAGTPILMLGVLFDRITTEETVELVAAMIASRQPHIIATANVDFTVQVDRDAELRRILYETHLVVCDGMPLVWASRVLGNPLPERVTGSDLVPRLIAEAEKRAWKVFFLGGTPESVAQAAANTRARHPRLQLVGAFSPPFRPVVGASEDIEADHAEIIRRIQEAKPDLLLVAFGCPKQEKWINKYYQKYGAPVSIGVGATIDFLAGTVQRAPVWMQRTGMEWLFRLVQEPRRLARRYGLGFWVFGRAILNQWLRLGSRHQPPPGPPALITRATPDATVLVGPARLDAVAVEVGRPTWEQAVGEAKDLIFDLSSTEFADSTGLGALVRLRKFAAQQGRGFALAGPRPRIVDALQLMKLTDYLPSGPDVVSARELAQRMRRETAVTLACLDRHVELSWDGEITAQNRDQIEARLETQLNSLSDGTRVVIDLRGVTFVDSAGVGLLVKIKRVLHRRNVEVTLAHPTESVLNVLRLTRLEQYLLGKAA